MHVNKNYCKLKIELSSIRINFLRKAKPILKTLTLTYPKLNPMSVKANYITKIVFFKKAKPVLKTLTLTYTKLNLMSVKANYLT